MRVYTFRLPKWLSSVTRVCLNLVHSSKDKSSKKQS